MEIGYHLSSEELDPISMVRCAARAEQVGFGFITVSDHYHPWTRRQGQSPFVWAVLGGIAASPTGWSGNGRDLPHHARPPGRIAQAAATAAVMMPGRFFLGVGTGEALNEHILGDRWPSSGVRREMLEEAVEVMRLLWKGGPQSHVGAHYTVEQATVFTLPDKPPPIIVSGFGTHSIDLAARVGDGYMNTKLDAEAAGRYRQGGGEGLCYGKMDVALADTEEAARALALETWPTSALAGELGQVLPLPAHFEAATALVGEEDVAESILCDQDPQAHIDRLREYGEAGYDRVAGAAGRGRPGPLPRYVRGVGAAQLRSRRGGGRVNADALRAAGRWPLVGQLRGDPLARGRAAQSQASRELRPRTSQATSVVGSICPYCAVGCGQKVYVKDGAVTQIEGDPDSPISRGRLCPKGSALEEPGHEPAARAQGQVPPPARRGLAGAGLDEAMDMIADRVIETRRGHVGDRTTRTARCAGRWASSASAVPRSTTRRTT